MPDARARPRSAATRMTRVLLPPHIQYGGGPHTEWWAGAARGAMTGRAAADEAIFVPRRSRGSPGARKHNHPTERKSVGRMRFG